MITRNSFDWNVIDHHSSRMPKQIVSDGKQMSIHTLNKQQELITGISRFCSESPTSNEQLHGASHTVGAPRICAEPEQRSHFIERRLVIWWSIELK
jgi:hypothetical protein